MKIVRLECQRREVPLTRPYTIARQTTSAVTLWFVRLVSDGPVCGVGSASPATGVTGETPEQCDAALREIAPGLLEGRDPRRRPALCRTLEEPLRHAPAARAALDMALHDLFARHLEIPLVELLGRRHTQLPTSITIGILPLDETLAEADEYVGRGFTCLKVKIGHDLETDLERLARLRERVGPEIRIRVDSNEGYTTRETRRFLAAYEPFGIELVEQPVPRGELGHLRNLPDDLRAELAADESLHDEEDALNLIGPPPAAGNFVIKLMKCGGISPALRIARIAELAEIGLMWGCMDESAVSITAALHAAFASPTTRFLDLDGNFDLAEDPGRGGFEVSDGEMRLRDEPGLGVELDG